MFELIQCHNINNIRQYYMYNGTKESLRRTARPGFCAGRAIIHKLTPLLFLTMTSLGLCSLSLLAINK